MKRVPVPLVDILKVSDEELPLLTGTTDCESGTAQLAQNGIRLIFVDLGCKRRSSTALGARLAMWQVSLQGG